MNCKFLFISLFISFQIFGQNQLSQYVASIEKANSTESWKSLALNFEKIAKAEPKNWYAQYYTALAHLEIANFSGKNIDDYCDKAEIYLNKAIQLEKNNAENYILKAYLLSTRIKENPMLRGMKYGKESKQQLEIALKLDSKNPRYYYIKGMGMYNTPSMFGGGSKKAKPFLEKAFELYKTQKLSSNLAPSWGRKQTQQLLNTYK